MSSNIYVGLEIGTSQVCVAVGEVYGDGSIRVIGVGSQPSRGVRKGEIVDQRLAQVCLADAVANAEDIADVNIAAVFLSVTGPHINSLNNSATLELPKRNDQIDSADVVDIKSLARDVDLPPEAVWLHSVVRHYTVDGQPNVLDPVGMYASEFTANYHLVHAVRNRVQNSIRCVAEIPLEVEDVVFSGFASAQVVATKEARNTGVLVVDFGAGTSDFVLYQDGAPLISGCVAVGGDHISNDISIVMNLPLARAEQLKTRYGHCRPNRAGVSPRIELAEEGIFAGREVERELLDQIIESRVREIFEVILRHLTGGDGRTELDGDLRGLRSRLGGGIVITGGSSLLAGLDELVQEITGIPVKTPKVPVTGWMTNVVDNPRYATAIGLIRSAQMFDEERAQRGPLGWIKNKLIDIFGSNQDASKS